MSRLVFITGASGGLGQALALRYYAAVIAWHLWRAGLQKSSPGLKPMPLRPATTRFTVPMSPKSTASWQPGMLVAIGSVAGVRGLPGHGAYCASKAAVISYCESLRGELRRSGVKVVTICPGYIDTALTRQNRYAMPFFDESRGVCRQGF